MESGWAGVIPRRESFEQALEKRKGSFRWSIIAHKKEMSLTFLSVAGLLLAPPELLHL